jgi:hypothetical protein
MHSIVAFIAARIDYEQADPSFMAVSAAIRYWRKHHPEELNC